MACLVCLRNEGIHFSDESPNDLEILRGLFGLPQEFTQTLEGNQCCSLCRVKLQFVEVIKHEIGILNEKLKCFKEEVKGIFVSSFDGNEEAIESNENFELATQARRKLLKELHLTVEMEDDQTSFEDNYSHISENEINSSWQPNGPNEDFENPMSDPLQVEPIFNLVKIEQNEEFANSTNSFVSQMPKDEPISSTSQEPNQYNSEIDSSSVERPIPFKSKLTMVRKSKSRSVKLENKQNVLKGKSPILSNPNNSLLSLNHRQRVIKMSNPTVNPGMSLNLTKTQRGKDMLLYEGFRFILEKKGANGKRIWRCTEWGKTKCKGRCHSIHNQVEYHTNNHNHIGDKNLQ